MGLVEDLKKDIAEGRVVVVVGAGVSVQATDGAECASWTGLLRNGVSHCAEFDPRLRDKWLGILHQEIESGDLNLLLSAAEIVTAQLGGRSGGEYRKWLKESVGALKVKNRTVLEAIQALGAPVATTNYDGLIEGITALNPITWRDHSEVEALLQGREPAVLHLHGYFAEPESVVLGIRSYDAVLGDEHAQAVLRALLLTKTLLFVGFGAGLQDPNFGTLLKWRERNMSGSESRSYRLAREKDCAELGKEHPAEQRIAVLNYGKEYDDLAAFLRSLAAGSAMPPHPEPPGFVPTLPGPRPCFGRDAEVQALVDHLLGSNPLPFPVLGWPGIGKSTITIAVLHHSGIVGRYGTRRYFVRCEAASSRSALAVAIAREMGIDPSPTVEPALLTRLAEAPALLVLDNFETPWEADESPVEELLANLAAVPAIGLVASVRGNERPGVVAWAEALRPEPLSRQAARQAFLGIVGKKFERDRRLDGLLAAVDHVPLAVMLLAHAAQPEPDLEGVWQRWQDERTAMLRRGTAASRELNLELSYEISLKSPRMTEDARRLLSVLALLPNGVAHADLTSIIPAGGLGVATVLRGTGLAYDEAGRLRLLAPIREYLKRQYPAASEDWDTAAEFYRRLVREHGNRVGAAGGADAARRLAPDAANIEQALLQYSENAAVVQIAEAAAAWAEFARFTGLGSIKPLEHAVTAARASAQSAALAKSLEALGDVYLARSDPGSAKSRYEAALPLYRQLGSRLGEANCIQGLGAIALDRSDHGEAKQRYEEALPLYRQLGSRLGEANCIQGLGAIALDRSDHGEAKQRYEEALPLYRQEGEVLGEANCSRRLGSIAFRRSDHVEATRRYGEALPLYRLAGVVVGEADCIRGLGDIALARSALGEATQLYKDALPLYRRLGNVLGEANCSVRLGDIALARSDHGEANKRYEEALHLFERIADRHSIGVAQRRLARISSTADDRSAHVRAAREAWLQIDRPDLIKQLDDEFGPPPAAVEAGS